MPGIVIEPATGDDLEAVTDRWVALVADQRDHGSHLLSEANRSEARDVISQYVHTDNVAVARLVADDADDQAVGDVLEPVVGFVMFHVETGLYDQDARRGVIDNVYVDPGYRDRDVGSKLLAYAEDELTSATVDVLALSVMFDNESARRLYARRGYDPHRLLVEKPAESDTHSKDDR